MRHHRPRPLKASPWNGKTYSDRFGTEFYRPESATCPLCGKGINGPAADRIVVVVGGRRRHFHKECVKPQ